jgi:hypothetical protein
VIRKTAPWIALGFVLWYLIGAPEAAAHTVKSAGRGLAAAADSLATFVNTLGDE